MSLDESLAAMSIAVVREELKTLLAEEAYIYHADIRVRLASGGVSHEYLDVRSVALTPRGAALIGCLFAEKLRTFHYNRVAAPILGGLPLLMAFLTTVGNELKPPETSGLLIRPEPKGHGIGGFFAGVPPRRGDCFVLLDDVATRGETLKKAINTLRFAGAHVARVLVLVDREPEDLHRLYDPETGKGHRIDSFYTLAEIRERVRELKGEDAIPDQYEKESGEASDGKEGSSDPQRRGLDEPSGSA